VKFFSHFSSSSPQLFFLQIVFSFLFLFIYNFSLFRIKGHIVFRRQGVRTVAVAVIEKQVVLFLLLELPVLYISFEYKSNPVGRVRRRVGILLAHILVKSKYVLNT
jgi:hypothetical protein